MSNSCILGGLRKRSRYISPLVALAVLMSGCATYTPTMVSPEPAKIHGTASQQEGVSLHVEQYVTKEKGKSAFDTNLGAKGLLPLLVTLENNREHPIEVSSVELLNGGEAPLKLLSPEEAAAKAKRGYVGKAVGWSLIVPIIAIPVAVAASSVHTKKVNDRMSQDFATKGLGQDSIEPRTTRSGFLFFEMEEKRESLSGLQLQVAMRNITSGKTITISAPLPDATFERNVGFEDEEDDT